MTTQEIYNEIVSDKASFEQLVALQPETDSSQQLLDDVASPARVANWRLFTWMIARAHKVLQDLFDFHKTWIEQRIAQNKVGSAPWYRLRSLEYQHGDNLVYDSNSLSFKYATVNAAAQVVKRAAIVEAANTLIIKIANLSGTNIIPLTDEELEGFRAYMKKVKFAGVKILVVSREADELRISLRVYYNPLVMAPDGSLLSDPAVFPVVDTLNSYIKNLPFNGIFNTTGLTDMLQATNGVVDPIVLTTEARSGVLPFAAFVDNYNANAGHMIIEPDYDLAANIEYLPAT
jgi:hypothetical protein